MVKLKKTPSNSYDKVIKENLEALLLPLARELLGIQIKKSEKVPGKLQRTLEREPDFIRIVEDSLGERFILHIEFQSSNEKHMIYRMKEYEAILSRKFRIPIRQFVVYIGGTPSKMKDKLGEKEVFRGFKLLNISSITSERLLIKDIPEAILLAVLGDFGKKSYASIFSRIYEKIKNLSRDETQLRKYLAQLEILSRLRNLEKQTAKLIQEMPITYDITTDYLYNQGKKEGKIEIIRNLLQSQAFLTGVLHYEDIASSCEVSVEQVKEIHQALQENKK